ncbi:uncharacterized protein AMSG_07282 [Thecamonas trahens ATCC 50062]|uniref:Kinesin-like protein n=1 Tax=Thecamonas trahens ATCC 50062 TaxID=461836 RepID=A0A0L0DIY0_THETB|nr:hypothetical protein AMSG_07282 [Thecamonas trahens ATCC 50062]KNC51278.1 hypothetical protein AMSG_07282 [Thecamonas trahens ATCC 50062]|eukprot:XP_013756205.1 hypothetical protein AMSG_07282 [Thecamonas trahens ATCC 50062]
MGRAGAAVAVVAVPGEATVRMVADQSGTGEAVYTYDSVYDDKVPQEALFEAEGHSVVDAVWSGFHACVFAYGQTGAGKSHTMMGSLASASGHGLIPRIAAALAELKASDDPEASIEFSFLEIYNESIRDLLADSAGRHELRLRESPHTGVYVEGLTRLAMANQGALMRALEVGSASRMVAATAMNAGSSRSHAVIELRVARSDGRAARLHLVDLAGSERQVATHAAGVRLKEACAINKSLSALANVIAALAKAAKAGRRANFVPYRNSVLTRLLQSSLGGNAVTCMIAAIAPGAGYRTETESTLRYASRAKYIRNTPKRNASTSSSVDVNALRARIAELEAAAAASSEGGSADAHGPELAELHTQLDRLTTTLADREAAAEAAIARREAMLADSGISLAELGEVFGTGSAPYLVNLNPETALSHTIVCVLRRDVMLLGSDEAAADIAVSAPGVAALHAELRLASETRPHVQVKALFPGASIHINGKLLDPSACGELCPGDRLVIGAALVFRLMWPHAAGLESSPSFTWHDAVAEMAGVLGLETSDHAALVLELARLVSTANDMAEGLDKPVVFSVVEDSGGADGVAVAAWSRLRPKQPPSRMTVAEFRARLEAMTAFAARSVSSVALLRVGEDDPFDEPQPDVLLGRGRYALTRVADLEPASRPLVLDPVLPRAFVRGQAPRLYVDIFLLSNDGGHTRLAAPQTLDAFYGTTVTVVVAVVRAVGMRKRTGSGVFVRYDYPEGDDVDEVTPRADVKRSGEVLWDYVDMFEVRVDENLECYLRSKEVEFEVWGRERE